MARHISNQIEKHNTPSDRRRYLFPHGKTGTSLFFYALMSRSRGKGSLVSWGFPRVKIKRQGLDTFPLKIGVLSRDRTQETAPHNKTGCGGHVRLPHPVLFVLFSSTNWKLFYSLCY